MSRLGADGLYDFKGHCYCMIDDTMLNCRNINKEHCTPAKLINGQWVPVEVEDKEYCEYTYKDYEYSSGKCRAETSCGISWYGEIELLHNFKHCPECSKKIREVK